MVVELRQALRSDLPKIVDVWVDAFAEDPYFRWIQPERSRWPAFGTEWMTFVAEACFERGHTYLTRDEGAAIAWIPPDLSLLSPDAVENALAILARHGGRARAEQAFETILAARAHDLEEPHWTLQYLGVRAASRGRNVGAAIVGPGLTTVDHDGLPCGVVSSNPRNVPFYERLGFTVTAEAISPDGQVALRPMHRPARVRHTTT